MRIKEMVNKHKFPAFISGIIILAIVLVAISMNMYYASDAFRLDLSRPEYLSLRSQITKDSSKQDDFDSQGDMSSAVLDDFLHRYNEESKKVLDTKAFSSDVLSDEQLGITAPGKQ